MTPKVKVKKIDKLNIIKVKKNFFASKKDYQESEKINHWIEGSIFTTLEDTVQVCSDDLNDSQCKELAEFIKANNIRMVNGPSNSLKKLHEALNYGVLKNGFLFQLGCFDVEGTVSIEHASKEQEFKDIAKLVCEANSSNTSYYGLQQFFNQIFRRYSDGYCRNIVVKSGSNIIGHVATYAETPFYWLRQKAQL